jgi:uncharacterized protein
MPKPLIIRKVIKPPVMSGFKPYGMLLCELDPVKLQFDEYESIKMVHYQKLPQDEAAQNMGISRPTFTRLYNKALNKIATAFVEGLPIQIEGGNVVFAKEWYKCTKCFKLIEGEEQHIKCEGCISYGRNELSKISQ